METQAEWSTVLERRGVRIIETLTKGNTLFLLSALLMLLGCYRLCFPYLFEFQSIRGIVTLIVVINLYEALVVGAIAFIARRLPTSSEVMTLLFVEMLFLLDASFTINGSLVIAFYTGFLIMTGSLMAALLKVYLLERCGAIGEHFCGLKKLLFCAVAFTYTMQLFVTPDGRDGNTRDLTMAGLWLVYGALFLLLPAGRTTMPNRNEADAVTFRRAAQIGLLFFPAFHLTGQTFVHYAPWHGAYLIPTLLTVAALLPVVLPRLRDSDILIWRIVLLAAAGVASGTAQFHSVSVNGVELSVFRLYATYAALLAGVVYFCEFNRVALHSAFILLSLVIAAIAPNRVNVFVRYPDLPNLVLLCVLWAAWSAVVNRFIFTAGLALIATQLGLGCIAQVDQLLRTTEFLYYAPIVLSLLANFSKHNRAWLTWPLLLIVFSAGLYRYQCSEMRDLYYFIAALWCLQLTKPKLKFKADIVVLLYLLSAAVSRDGLPRAAASFDLGWSVIVLAFVLFGLGFASTRRRLISEQRTV